MDSTLADMRRDYMAEGLSKDDVLADPIAQFERWFEAAQRAEVPEPNGMALATVGADGQPAARTVLLKIADQRGLAFFTNLESRKGHELAANPKAALLFWWAPLARQVRFEGPIERVDEADADSYFASRPLGSRIGAWASAQSTVVANRAVLDEAERAYGERFAGQEVPRPPFWGGYRLVPLQVEFWQGRENRLHDRLLYSKTEAGSWQIERLAP